MNAVESSSDPALTGPEVGLVAFGDVGLAGLLDGRLRWGEGPVLLAGVRERLAAADLVVGNFEFPVKPEEGNPGAWVRGGRFLCDPRAGEVFHGLERVVYSLANNHAMDAGLEGIRATERVLHGIGAVTLGAGATEAEARGERIIECRGLKIGFLAGCKRGEWSATNSRPGAADLDLRALIAGIARLKSSGAEAVIVACHWGVEFCSYPDPDQIRIGRALVDAGASLVLGHHPHTLQGMERWKGGLIVYSLGNFIMDMALDRPPTPEALADAMETGLLRITLNRGGVVAAEMVPIRLVEGVPQPLADAEAESRARARFEELCREIGTERFQQTAFGNLWRRELGSWSERIRSEGFRGVLRLLRSIKPRHFRMMGGFVWKKIFAR